MVNGMDDTTTNGAGQQTRGPITPLTQAQWGERIDRETNGKLGRFRFLERSIFSSRAYRSLDLPAREILHCYLNKIEFERTKRNSRPGRRRNDSAPLNANNLVVTNGEIKARGGVKSDRTISNARKRLVEIGFLDVVRPGAFPQPGVFALSNRYLNFPDGVYQPQTAVSRIFVHPVLEARFSRKCPKGTRGFPNGRH
jgi:hypothetical protein